VATGWVRAALGLGEMLALNISSLFRRARQNIFCQNQKKSKFTVKK
jgi:hypothetical protein